MTRARASDSATRPRPFSRPAPSCRDTCTAGRSASRATRPLESISGGTDILGCFVLGSPWSDTYEGESSGIGLGLDVRAWGDAGPSREGAGELVCVAPFPSRPVAFLDDPDGARLRDAYYAQHAGAWTHGDLVDDGGARNGARPRAVRRGA